MTYANVRRVDLKKACDNYIAHRSGIIESKQAELVKKRMNLPWNRWLKRSEESIIRSLSCTFGKYTLLELMDGYRYVKVMGLLKLCAATDDVTVKLSTEDAWVMDFLKHDE
jgi:hypothetical protein